MENQAVLIMKIDHFNRYSNFHGLMEGNRCLKRISTYINSFIESRNGSLERAIGEEFVCLLKDIKQDELFQLADKLRKKIEEMSFLYCWDQHSYSLTLSIGGVYGESNQFKSMEEMYEMAEEAFNKVKMNSPNSLLIEWRN